MPENNINVLLSQSQLGITQVQSNLIDSEKNLQETLAKLETTVGKENAQLAVTCSALGTTLLLRGDIKHAEKFLDRAQPILFKHYSEDHFETLNNFINYATVFGKEKWPD